MIYKNYIYIFNWKTKSKKVKTIFSERTKSEVVIIWFTYLFVDIDTQIRFVNWSEPLVYIFSEFNEVSFCFHIFWEWIPNMRTQGSQYFITIFGCLMNLYLYVIWSMC